VKKCLIALQKWQLPTR